MRRLRTTAIVILALVAAACGANPTDRGAVDPAARPDTQATTSDGPLTTPALTITPRPKPPATSAPRPDGEPIRALILDEISFELFDQGEDCLAVFISGDDITSIAESRCFNQFNPLAETTSCGWLAGSDGRSVCDAELPVVFFGRVTNRDIGYVCTGAFGDTDVDAGVTGARFLQISDDRVIFEPAEPGESARAAHLYGSAGNRYGEPPLDAPSGYIYERCEGLAPWGESGPEYFILLNVYFAEELRTDAVTAWFDGGLGTTGLSGAAYDEVPAEFDVRAAASSRGLTIAIDSNDSAALQRTTYPWPEEVAAILAAFTECFEPISVDVFIDELAVEGDPSAVTLALDSAACS